MQPPDRYPPSLPALLVVGGAMRGGTSLLQRLLDSHPLVQLMERELRALRYADLATWAHAAAVHQSFTTPLHRIRDAVFRRQVYRYLSRILRGHRLYELTTIDRIHEALAGALANATTRYVGDKYPDYVLMYPPFIHRPNTRCIFVHRDPRDVVASILDRVHHGDWKGHQWTTRYDTVEKATDYWCHVMQALGDVQRLETNALVLRYDDLVLRRADAIGSIARHLDLPDDGFDTTLAHAESVGRYRQRLTAAQVEIIEQRAGAMMELWGYHTGESA